MRKSWFIKGINKILGNFFCLLIRFYQICISPLFGAKCRYTPTCSHYAIEAIKKHGPFKGIFLAFKRILRCNPYFEGGYDPVPKYWFEKRKKYG